MNEGILKLEFAGKNWVSQIVVLKSGSILAKEIGLTDILRDKR